MDVQRYIGHMVRFSRLPDAEKERYLNLYPELISPDVIDLCLEDARRQKEENTYSSAERYPGVLAPHICGTDGHRACFCHCDDDLRCAWTALYLAGKMEDPKRRLQALSALRKTKLAQRFETPLDDAVRWVRFVGRAPKYLLVVGIVSDATVRLFTVEASGDLPVISEAGGFESSLRQGGWGLPASMTVTIRRSEERRPGLLGRARQSLLSGIARQRRKPRLVRQSTISDDDADCSGTLRAVAVAPMGSLIVTGLWRPFVSDFDPEERARGIVRIWQRTSGHSSCVSEICRMKTSSQLEDAALSPDGRILAVATRLGVSMWHVGPGPNREWKQLCELRDDIGNDEVEFVAAGSYLAVGSGCQTISLYDTKTWSKVRILHPNLPMDHDVVAVAFSHDGQILAQYDYDREKVYLWDAGSDRVLDPWLTKEDLCGNLVFSPSRQLLAVGTRHGKVCLSNLETGEVHALRCNGKPVQQLAFSPDGRLMAAVSENEIALWRV